MIASFLRGEVRSPRFDSALEDILASRGWSADLLTDPDPGDAEECRRRSEVLAAHRDFGRDRGLFEGFPSGIAWARWRLERTELFEVRYIDYSFWNELSAGSRSPRVAASRIRDGRTAFDISNHGFFEAVAALEAGQEFHELILVRAHPNAPIVVLEGHLRITAYALAPGSTPDPLDVILGEHEDFEDWPCY